VYLVLFIIWVYTGLKINGMSAILSSFFRFYCDSLIWQQAVAKLAETPWVGWVKPVLLCDFLGSGLICLAS